MNINSLSPNSVKFNTCKFRSESEVEKTIKRCSCQGGDLHLKGYWCEKKRLFQITENICSQCEEYESK
jgi:hypothetical protein